VLRLQIGESVDAASIASLPTKPTAQVNNSQAKESQTSNHVTHRHSHESETVDVLETALDDLSPQVIAYVTETALASGALDVMLTPVLMKKGRPGTLLTILCNPSDRPAMERLLLRETSTLGVRIRHDHRRCLARSHTTVQTPYGDIRVKAGSLGDEEFNAAPEYEDCRAAAVLHAVPLKQVQQAASAAYQSLKHP
jgi:hypothetical protein